jgi:AraC-like DNA-binding protein
MIDGVSAQTYVDRPPIPALGDLVRVVWIQQIGTEPYLQRDLPTGGVELHCPIGSIPRLVGPLTHTCVEILAPADDRDRRSLSSGAAAAVLGLPASELVDLTLDLSEVWGPAAVVLSELLLATSSPEAALGVVQDQLVRRRAGGTQPDPLVSELVRQLMQRQVGEVSLLGSRLAISQSQLRRRCLAAVGMGPKALQRTLRFQGFLALVQSGALVGPGAGGDLAALAAEAGYADQAHLSRECLRLAGLPPRAFVGDVAGRCTCGHDHSASFVPILRARFAAGGVAA